MPTNEEIENSFRLVSPASYARWKRFREQLVADRAAMRFSYNDREDAATVLFQITKSRNARRITVALPPTPAPASVHASLPGEDE